MTFQKIISGSNSDQGIVIQQTPDMGYILQGNTGTPFASNNEDIYLAKTDSTGTILWYKVYGSTAESYYGYSSFQTGDGGFIVSGLLSSSSTFLFKTNSIGDTLWTKQYGGTGYTRGYKCTQTNDGGYIMVGYNYYPDTTSTCAPFSCPDVLLIKTDSLGDTL
ncbi:MAG: hypothetical protein JKX74_01950 [Flavobacteriales bacterium]|nr:hypothetical protein [Flavobacteriales bacterium]